MKIVIFLAIINFEIIIKWSFHEYNYFQILLMKSLLKRLFLQLDLFSVNPTFYINNSQTHKTTLGAIVSILIMLFMIFSLISMMQDVN